MSLPPDYHMHTPLCRHAVGAPAEYAARAVAAGLGEIGFSDHAPMPRDDFDCWRMKLEELDLYVAQVEETRRAFPSLRIRLALEVDYLPGCEDWIRQLAARHPWDYLIGSVHYLSAWWAIDSPFQMSEWRTRDPFEVWSAYFDLLARAAASGLFDIIGHADLCKKFCFYPKQDCEPLYARFVAAAAGSGVAMEINTAGLRKDCRELYPGPQLLGMAVRAGVPLTFGSDAHAPEEVGLNFGEAVAAARAAGAASHARFEGRRALVEELRD